jgi:hypothetical protein
VKLTAFGVHPIPVIGKCYLRCTHKDSTRIVEFHVVDTGTSLLGCADCKSMQLYLLRLITLNKLRAKRVPYLDYRVNKYLRNMHTVSKDSEGYLNHIKVNPIVTPLGNCLHLLETEFIANCRLWKRTE